MIREEIKTFTYPNGEIQRVQLVRLPDWHMLEFLPVAYSEPALEGFCGIYSRYLVPACPWLFGNLVLFHIPADMQADFPMDTGRYGTVADRVTAAAAVLRQGLRIHGEKPVFRNDRAKALWQALKERNSIAVVRGKLPVTTIIPVGDRGGFLSQVRRDARLKVNASFFIMDRFDCATVYDHIGTHLGLCVKNGVVENPPLFGREALLVGKDGSVGVEAPALTDLTMRIGGKCYRHGQNAVIYSRPERAKTPPRKGKKLIIVGCRVVAVHTADRVNIPASGFVLCPAGECDAAPGDTVTYTGMENILFGIQVGNSILRGGKKTDRFISRFYNIRALERIPFPPSLYPMGFDTSRAARIALGADGEGKPMLIWAEGAGKLHYTPGQDSRGATLADMADICSQLGMVNAVNLDGGGSAQILVDNRRSLRISDRNEADNSEAERAVPIALMIP